MNLNGQRLVIFGCGYVGSAVAGAALQAGARVEALTRNPEKALALRAAGVAKVVVAELASSDWHGQLEGGADFVVNCVSSGGGGAEGYRKSYFEGMASILAWAAKGPTPIGSLLYTSSTSVYGQGDGARVDESFAADGGTANGAIIRDSEKLLEAATRAQCRRWFVLRLAGIYGPSRHHLLDQLREGAATLNGSGEHHLNLIHRDDIVSAILSCVTAPDDVAGGVFNVADRAPAPRADVVAWLAKRLGHAVPVFDGSTTARRGGAPMPDRIIVADKLRRALGWEPRFVDFRAGFENILSP